jgi:hypothetical protein
MSEDLVLKLTRGEAKKAADRFGFVQALVETGHAFGYNIVTGYNDVPTRDLDPLYLRVAGLEVQFLLDSTSYAWDSSGLVVSSDLLLVGATGYVGSAPPATSWVRLPVPVAGLNAAPATVADLTVKANSGAIPTGFNPDNPASVAAALATLSATGTDRYGVAQAGGAQLIGPVLLIEDVDIYTGPSILVEEFPYALVLPTEEFTLGTGPSVREVAFAEVPAAVVAVASLAPAVLADTVVSVPAAVVTVEALAPGASTGASVEVPAAVVAVVGLAPVVTSEAGVAEPNIGDAYGGGYFAGYISHTADGVATHRLIVAPAATGATGTGYTLTTMQQWKTGGTTTTDTGSSFDGAANTAAMVTAGINSHPAAKFCVDLAIGGFTDWYLPSRLELDIAYENLKPTTTTNITNTGINAYSVPARASNRTTSVPPQTSVALFRSSGSEAFVADWHWSSTETAASSANRREMDQGSITTTTKTVNSRVRAFRKVAI